MRKNTKKWKKNVRKNIKNWKDSKKIGNKYKKKWKKKIYIYIKWNGKNF